MKVRDCHTIRKVADDGTVSFETEERWLEIDNVLSADEANTADAAQAIIDYNAAIKAQLAAADLAIVRALVEGDTARLQAHAASQAALRAKLK